MSQHQYTVRINDVINYIHSHLEEDLSLQQLAQVATFSPFHFHRLFYAFVGETVHQYVQRTRLERSAYRLIHQPNLTVTELSLSSGFSSPSTYSRAFKNHYGCNPSQYRKQYQYSKISNAEGKISKVSSPGISYDKDVVTTTQTANRRNPFMKVEVKKLPLYHVAYIRHLQGYEDGVYNHALNQAFQEVAEWMIAHQLMSDKTLSLGIFHEYGNVTSPEKRRYDAAFTLPEETELEIKHEKISFQTVGGGRYAICRISVNGTPEQPDQMAEAIAKMEKAFDYLYKEWLPESAYELDDKPSIEIYCPLSSPAHIVIDACIPVRPL
ncbi:GyrI-like domain-containing protein [Mechercharimyces sp. CAU 1602]|uniref:AraC family transcriptional regulator n=1 Tax=Mechercharimyces sp. CAU 1602 TaxID=2973933 RepID=UPI0021632233|nr:AraC family transcriptional regulator [Mechercharimyces sp. CAU 1602]MCS1349975.1 AraC family transcriptional regulator [Mechercharimyces sp. CAU 1602]